METNSHPTAANRPSPQEADAALRESQQLRSELRDKPVPVPPWFYPVLGICFAGLSLAQLLPTLPSILLMIVLTAALGACIGGAASTARYTPRMSTPLIITAMLFVLALIAASVVLDRVYDQQWVWYPLAGLGLLLALILGLLHRRASRKQAQ